MRNDMLAGLAALIALSACSPASAPGNDVANDAADIQSAEAAGDAARSREPAADEPRNYVAEANTAAFPPVEPPAPGTPGGLPDDRTPVSEAPFTETSAQGAANVVQTYFAMIEGGKYGDAWRLWSDGGKASGMTRDAFAASFAKYAEYHAQIGAPGAIEGAAGSLYVEVPVVVYGRLKSGAEVHMNGPVTLRRVNDVDGSTAEQRKWHIASTALKPRPN
ncbi:hypothetical protein [Sphingosinicella sp. BN140058]|uniref:hypothetical protein n=1 Tax=Sphingosinicella sp. BN140058 TaxID=1892855 RepID=UPI001011CDC0|nr:hypothetical protein [Sphingosinicella sp. BN140058]QAY77810.1 hypothetical protein ETR14_15760 [Sphingosinicella sp. BN140058]